MADHSSIRIWLPVVVAGLLILLLLAMALAAQMLSSNPFLAVDRTITINASCEQVHAYVRQMENTRHWLPWLQMDPQAHITLTGPPQGEGAMLQWQSSTPLGFGVIRVSQDERSATHNNALIAYHPVYHQDQVHWVMASLLIQESYTGQSQVTFEAKGLHSHRNRLLPFLQEDPQKFGLLIEQGLVKLKSQVEAKTSETAAPAGSGQ